MDINELRKLLNEEINRRKFLLEQDDSEKTVSSPLKTSVNKMQKSKQNSTPEGLPGDLANDPRFADIENSFDEPMKLEPFDSDDEEELGMSSNTFGIPNIKNNESIENYNKRLTDYLASIQREVIKRMQLVQKQKSLNTNLMSGEKTVSDRK